MNHSFPVPGKHVHVGRGQIVQWFKKFVKYLKLTFPQFKLQKTDLIWALRNAASDILQ